MAASAINIPNQTFVWKHDSSAGDMPVKVYYSSKDESTSPRPIGKEYSILCDLL